MKSRNAVSLIVLALLSFGYVELTSAAEGQHLGLGAFFESRTENKITGSDLTFRYSGIRLTYKDDAYFDAFLDMGSQSLDLDGFAVDASGAFGLGGTVWILRSDDSDFLVDFGVLGSYYVADYAVGIDGVSFETDVRYKRFLVQAVLFFMSNEKAQPFLRAGMQNSNLDAPSDGVLIGSNLSETKPAVNVGVKLAATDQLSVLFEANYSQMVGAGIHIDYWF